MRFIAGEKEAVCLILIVSYCAKVLELRLPFCYTASVIGISSRWMNSTPLSQSDKIVHDNVRPLKPVFLSACYGTKLLDIARPNDVSQ